LPVPSPNLRLVAEDAVAGVLEALVARSAREGSCDLLLVLDRTDRIERTAQHQRRAGHAGQGVPEIEAHAVAREVEQKIEVHDRAAQCIRRGLRPDVVERDGLGEVGG
jgi:hypothetical protein